MTDEAYFGKSPPENLAEARAIAHQAAQLLTRAARANLPAADHDSHSNLGWDQKTKVFLTQPLSAGGEDFHTGLSVQSLVLSLNKNKNQIASISLDGQSVDSVASWLDILILHLGWRFGNFIY